VLSQSSDSFDRPGSVDRVLPFRWRLLCLALPLLLLIGVLSVVEWSVRRSRVFVTPLEFFVVAPEQHYTFKDRANVGIFEGDPWLFWKLKPNLRDVVWDFTLVSTNAQGIRREANVQPKPRGTFRVVCVGDSVTFGFRVPAVLRQDPNGYDRAQLPYPALMEAMLRAENPGRSVEVIPLAVPGYSSHQGLAWIRRDIAWLDPDLVTACFGWNDTCVRSQSDRDTMATDRFHAYARSLIGHSQALIYANRWWAARRASNPASPATALTARVPADEFVSNFREIAALAGKRKNPFVAIGPVYQNAIADPAAAARIAGYRRLLREAMTAEGIPYLEMPLLTEAGWPENEMLFGEAIHPSHLGHRVMARAILEFLSSRGLLAGMRVPPPSRRPVDGSADRTASARP
jgi:lysophospholipase L1-like esterase